MLYCMGSTIQDTTFHSKTCTIHTRPFRIQREPRVHSAVEKIRALARRVSLSFTPLFYTFNLRLDPPMSERRYVEFESIHSGIQSDVGRFRLAPNGIGWKSTGNKTTVIAADDVKKVSWSRAARGHQVRIVVKDNTIYKFDGFRSEVCCTGTSLKQWI